MIDRRRFEGSRRQVRALCDKAAHQANPSFMVDQAEQLPVWRSASACSGETIWTILAQLHILLVYVSA